ncbi:hypothetical protein RV11_GL001951 [Enterococcus phoeniculicola]|jgi:hypothetical protein|uniref:Uncharacterized protein n=1 Tax=Enterococcus phoeniculicola ATCC BAA-412 TaxID=1158610 RepID=R3W443_9ENTE|nr:hypothetical protein UC3_02754 [Enterococcus phoeniculicola ATCC BAA-412]EOT79319.1 hypothetical protein I589_00827 [Enterococcus phoeniculicola ATCC BAA-412]OJG73141.1 hypothetical protein RV11_GL001951 [Enterococcus phoeniculicola]
MIDEESFKEIGLTIVSYPITVEDGVPVYAGHLKELPMIAASAHSKQQFINKLSEKYLAYREEHMEQSPEEESNLTIDELLRYYDGETFDGFDIGLNYLERKDESTDY